MWNYNVHSPPPTNYTANAMQMPYIVLLELYNNFRSKYRIFVKDETNLILLFLFNSLLFLLIAEIFC